MSFSQHTFSSESMQHGGTTQHDPQLDSVECQVVLSPSTRSTVAVKSVVSSSKCIEDDAIAVVSQAVDGVDRKQKNQYDGNGPWTLLEEMWANDDNSTTNHFQMPSSYDAFIDNLYPASMIHLNVNLEI